MPRQTVHFADIAVLVDRFGVEVVRRKVVASVYEDAVKISLLAGHPMKGFDI